MTPIFDVTSEAYRQRQGLHVGTWARHTIEQHRLSQLACSMRFCSLATGVVVVSVPRHSRDHERRSGCAECRWSRNPPHAGRSLSARSWVVTSTRLRLDPLPEVANRVIGLRDNRSSAGRTARPRQSRRHARSTPGSGGSCPRGRGRISLSQRYCGDNAGPTHYAAGVTASRRRAPVSVSWHCTSRPSCREATTPAARILPTWWEII